MTITAFLKESNAIFTHYEYLPFSALKCWPKAALQVKEKKGKEKDSVKS